MRTQTGMQTHAPRLQLLEHSARVDVSYNKHLHKCVRTRRLTAPCAGARATTDAAAPSMSSHGRDSFARFVGDSELQSSCLTRGVGTCTLRAALIAPDARPLLCAHLNIKILTSRNPGTERHRVCGMLRNDTNRSRSPVPGFPLENS